ncbi:MAG TPA: hypothetical protein VHP33_21925 [Polyangiaceae bacterium]|nr:hypothetical protein [Polyangiaceae bacterium]
MIQTRLRNSCVPAIIAIGVNLSSSATAIAQMNPACAKAAQKLATRKGNGAAAYFVEQGAFAVVTTRIAAPNPSDSARLPSFYSSSQGLLTPPPPQTTYPGAAWDVPIAVAVDPPDVCSPLYVAHPLPFFAGSPPEAVVRAAYAALPASQRLPSSLRAPASALPPSSENEASQSSLPRPTDGCNDLARYHRFAGLQGTLADAETDRLRSEVLRLGLDGSPPGALGYDPAASAMFVALMTCQVAYARGDIARPAECPYQDLIATYPGSAIDKRNGATALGELYAMAEASTPRKRLRHAVRARIALEPRLQTCQEEAAQLESAMFVDLGGTPASKTATRYVFGLSGAVGLLSGVRFDSSDHPYAGPWFATAGVSGHYRWARINIGILNFGEYRTLDKDGNWRGFKPFDALAPSFGLAVSDGPQSYFELGGVVGMSRGFTSERTGYFAVTVGVKRFCHPLAW